MTSRCGKPSLHAIEGGRAALERQALSALVHRLPTFASLLNRLAPASNSTLSLVKAGPDADAPEPPAPTDAASDAHRT